ncbi:hypothetical protein GGH96_003258 [Coemansia sp. RSA 1972]|nr:hypothetical protein GGH96_003258 [Coemansia sp. RSA 1972]
MSHPLTVTYDKSLELTQAQTSDTIFVTQSNNLLLIIQRLNTLLAARGDKQINYEDVELEIFNKSSDGKRVLTGGDTLYSKNFVPTKKEDTLNQATLRKKGADKGGCIIM